MWRLINFSLVLLCLFGRANFLQAQEIQTEKQTVDEQLSCNDITSPAYYDNLSYLPVKFLNRQKESEILVAQFASPVIFSAKSIEFKLTPETKEEKGLFLQVDGEWQEIISRKVFFKKFKKDFWLVSYLTLNNENVICGAQQFNNWRSLEVSYAQGSQNFHIGTIEFWKDLKSTPAYFHEIKEDRAFWFFLQDTNSMFLPEQQEETIRFENGKLVNKYQRSFDGTVGKILDHDFFIIDPNCVFNVLEKKDQRLIQIPKIKITQVELRSYKIRSKQVDREHFIRDALKEPIPLWFCFYKKDFKNKALVLLRVVRAVPDEESNGKDKNSKNGSPRSSSGRAGNGKKQNGKNGNKLKK